MTSILASISSQRLAQQAYRVSNVGGLPCLESYMVLLLQDVA